MTRATWLLLSHLLLVVGCGGPDTLHYRLRDPQLVTVSVDGQPAFPSPDEVTRATPQRYDLRMRTGDDSLADVAFTLERTPSGIYGKWDTNLPLSHGDVFELVGEDGWIVALPTGAPARSWQDQLVFDLVPRLSYWSARHGGGYVSSFAGKPYSGEHTVRISTPRSNLIAAELRGDRSRLWIGLAMLVPGAIYSGAGAAALLSEKHVGGKIVGGVFAAVGATLDVGAIYEIVRGARRKTLHP